MSNISPYSYNPIEEQFVSAETFYPVAGTSWCQRLQFAVLEEAITALNYLIPPPGSHGRQRAADIRREAREFFQSNATNHLFTFLRICEGLNLEPHGIRKGVLQPGFRLPRESIRLSTRSQNGDARPTVEQERVYVSKKRRKIAQKAAILIETARESHQEEEG
jgi:hypothetical protein